MQKPSDVLYKMRGELSLRAVIVSLVPLPGRAIQPTVSLKYFEPFWE